MLEMSLSKEEIYLQCVLPQRKKLYQDVHFIRCQHILPRNGFLNYAATKTKY
jgi:hypothetical protein